MPYMSSMQDKFEDQTSRLPADSKLSSSAMLRVATVATEWRWPLLDPTGACILLAADDLRLVGPLLPSLVLASLLNSLAEPSPALDPIPVWLVLAAPCATPPVSSDDRTVELAVPCCCEPCCGCCCCWWWCGGTALRSTSAGEGGCCGAVAVGDARVAGGAAAGLLLGEGGDRS